MKLSSTSCDSIVFLPCYGKDLQWYSELKGILVPAGYAATEIQLYFQVVLPLCAPSYLLKAAGDNIISKLSKVGTPAVLSWPGGNLTCVLPLHLREPENFLIVRSAKSH